MMSPAVLASTMSPQSPVDFSQRPMLVFWETTRACLLACRHCRASATTQAPPGELSTAEGRALIDQVARLRAATPILCSPAATACSGPTCSTWIDLRGVTGRPGVPVPVGHPAAGCGHDRPDRSQRGRSQQHGPWSCLAKMDSTK